MTNFHISDIEASEIISRQKVHTKIVTAITFDPHNDLYSISLDRNICRLNNIALKAKSNVDERYLPIHLEYCTGFLLVITNGGQIKMLNPETLICRKILRFDGLPQVIPPF